MLLGKIAMVADRQTMTLGYLPCFYRLKGFVVMPSLSPSLRGQKSEKQPIKKELGIKILELIYYSQN